MTGQILIHWKNEQRLTLNCSQLSFTSLEMSTSCSVADAVKRDALFFTSGTFRRKTEGTSIRNAFFIFICSPYASSTGHRRRCYSSIILISNIFFLTSRRLISFFFINCLSYSIKICQCWLYITIYRHVYQTDEVGHWAIEEKMIIDRW